MSETDTFTFVEKPYVASLEEKLAAAEARIAELTKSASDEYLLRCRLEGELEPMRDYMRRCGDRLAEDRARLAELEAALAERRGVEDGDA